MAMRRILTQPDPALRAVCAEVVGFGEALRALVDDMFETMYAATGRGLAAPQVGELHRVFVMDCTWKDGDRAPRVFVNPVIVSRSEACSSYQEGCLSIPGQTTEVSRPSEVEMQWQTVDGERQSARFDGFEAVCVQHELDHLNGVLCIDYEDVA